MATLHGSTMPNPNPPQRLEAPGDAPRWQRGGARLPALGREEELWLLRRAVETVRSARSAQLVTLVGPHGVGKTALIDLLLDEIRGDSRPMRVYKGSARESASSYAAFASLLRSRFGLTEGMAPDAARDQIRTQVAKVLDDRKVGDVCFFIGQLIGLPFDESPLTRVAADDPHQGRVLRQAVIRTFFEMDAGRRPLCLIFDDLESVGEDSLALLSYLGEHLRGPVLLLCAAQPEMFAAHPDWFSVGGDRHTRVDVGPLPLEVSREVMRELLSPCEGGAPEALVEAGVRLAGGAPGLLASAVRIFHDAGVLDEVDALAQRPTWRVRLDRLSEVALPLTVEDAIAMRLAALRPEERHLAEQAAAMGYVFWLGGLVALRRLERRVPALWDPEDDADVEHVRSILESLVQRGYLEQRLVDGPTGAHEYVFRDERERSKLIELTAEAATRRYHQTIADWLAHSSQGRAREDQLGTLAHHLEKAGSPDRAALVYLEAADAARASYAARKAREYYEQGLTLLGERDARRRVDALHNYGDVLLLLGHTDEALTVFRQMLALSYRFQWQAKGGAAHNRIGRLYRATGALAEAMQHLETALALFQHVGDDRGVASCHDDVGKVLWTRGEYKQALRRMKTSLEMRKKLGDRRSIALSFHNIGVVWRDHGRPNKAREALQASLEIRKEIGDLVGVAQALDSLGRLAQDQRDLEKARELFDQAYEVTIEIGERNGMATVLTNLGEVHYRLGDTARAIEILEQAEELCDELGDKLHLAEAKRGLAKAHLLQGDLRKARHHIKRAVDLFGQVRSKSHLATALRTLGEITAAGAWGAAHEGKAVDYFLHAIALCKEIGNDLEVAKSYKTFSHYVSQSGHYADNSEIMAQATKLSAMADEIFQKHRRDTDPGAEEAP